MATKKLSTVKRCADQGQRLLRSSLFFLLLGFTASPAALLQTLSLLNGVVMGVDWVASVPSRAEITLLNELRLHDGYVEVESPVYDFSTADSVDLNFDVTVPFNLLGLVGSAPNPGENLRVDYLDDNGNWNPLTTFVPDNGFLGILSLGNAFNYSASLPSDAYHDSFQLRYVMLGGGFSLFDLLGDNWYVSNITLLADLVPSGPDHYRFDYASPGLTCSPQAVTLLACADSGCSSLYTDSVTVDLSPTGWTGGSTVTFSGGSVALALTHTTAEPVTLAVTSSLPATIGGGTECTINGGAASGNCELVFADSGFDVSVSDFLARRSTTGVIRAVKKDDVTQKCVPAFSNVARNLTLWSDYIAPDDSGRVVNWPVSVDGAPIGTSLAGAVNRTVSFDADGVASVSVNYSDVGNTRLNVVYNDSGLVMTGNDDFVVYPAGLCVTTTTECADADASCTPKAYAGESFSMTVTAVAWENDGDTNYCSGNTGTPNYRATGLALASVAVAPAPANSNGSVAPGTYSHAASYNSGTGTGGDNTISVSQSEVGVFRFDVTAPDYQGHALGTYSSLPGGRFYPHHFDLAIPDSGSLNPSCSAGSAYAYIGEPVSWFIAPELTITARNLAGDVTQNYTEDGFNQLAASDILINGPVTDDIATGTGGAPMPVTTSLNPGALTVTAPGQMQYLMNPADQLTYVRNNASEVEPFTPVLTYQVSSVTDADGVNLTAAQNFSPNAPFEMRYGRLWLESNHGSSEVSMIVPLRTEYLSSGRFTTHTDDSCTSWDSSRATVAPYTVSPDSWITSLLPSAGTLVSGRSSGTGLLLDSPLNVIGASFTGTARVTYDAQDWLDYDYDGDGNPDDVGADANFGVARGHERVIFSREVR